MYVNVTYTLYFCPNWCMIPVDTPLKRVLVVLEQQIEAYNCWHLVALVGCSVAGVDPGGLVCFRPRLDPSKLGSPVGDELIITYIYSKHKDRLV